MPMVCVKRRTVNAFFAKKHFTVVKFAAFAYQFRSAPFHVEVLSRGLGVIAMLMAK